MNTLLFLDQKSSNTIIDDEEIEVTFSDAKAQVSKEQALIMALRAYYTTKDINELLEKSSEFYQDVKSLSINAKLHLNVDMIMEEKNGSIDMDVKYSIDQIVDPIKLKSIIEGQIAMEMMRENVAIPMDIEQYMVIDNDEIITYSVSQDTSTGEPIYQKLVTPFSEELLNTVQQNNSYSDYSLYDKIRLIDEEIIDGNVIYTVSMELKTDEDFKGIMNDMYSGMSQQLGYVDIMSDMEGIIYLYKLNANTGEIINVTVDLAEVLNNTINGLMALENESNQNTSIKVNNFAMEMEYKNINHLEDIEIPQEVIDNAIDMNEYMESLEEETEIVEALEKLEEEPEIVEALEKLGAEASEKIEILEAETLESIKNTGE